NLKYIFYFVSGMSQSQLFKHLHDQPNSYGDITFQGPHLHQETKTRKFQCPHCDRSFKAGLHLKDHLNSHTGEKPYTCEICRKGFTQLSTKRRHIRQYHKLKN
ncbi:unnamed protein product, partial [Owenia fusiformis]